jgi:hypothetical protein
MLPFLKEKLLEMKLLSIVSCTLFAVQMAGSLVQ